MTVDHTVNTVTAPNDGPRSFSWLCWLLPILPLLLWAIAHYAIPEPALFYLINHQAQSLPDVFWGFFVFLGNGWGIYSLVFPLALLAPRLLATGVLSGLIAGLASRALKLWLDFPRPASVLDNSTFHIVGNPLLHLSLPSGHTLTAFAVAAAFYFSIDAVKRKYAWILFLIAMGTGLARVAVGAHWPADVFAGACVGILSGLIGASVCNRMPDTSFDRKSRLHWIFMIGALVDAYMLSSTVLDFTTNHPYQMIGMIVLAITLFSLAAQVVADSRRRG